MSSSAPDGGVPRAARYSHAFPPLTFTQCSRRRTDLSHPLPQPSQLGHSRAQCSDRSLGTRWTKGVKGVDEGGGPKMRWSATIAGRVEHGT